MTLLEAVVTLIVIALVALIATPFILQGLERARRTACELNLISLGRGLQAYESVYRHYPIGSRYQSAPPADFGTSWWNALLAYVDNPEGKQHWADRWAASTAGGDFSERTVNPNTPLVDGRRPVAMYCPASPLPRGNDPLRHMSAENRALVGGRAQGIPTPHYVAIAGSAPDMKGVDEAAEGPQGRNTRDGLYGILSASGAFPPNRRTYQASLRDGAAHVIMLAEQSDWGLDSYYEPPLKYDLRSCWPGGAFMGAAADYGELSPDADGVNGSGEARALNITTVRHPINTRFLASGIVAQPQGEIPPPPQGKPARLHPPLPPGPGHNQGIFSAHPGGANVLMGDGRARWLADGTSLRVLRLLATRDDVQVVPEP